MRKISSIVTYGALLLASISCSCQNSNRNTPQLTSNELNEIGALPTIKSVFTHNNIRPGNMAVTSDGRMFITINPLTDTSTKLYEITSSEDAVPYPNKRYSTGENSLIKGAIGIRADSSDNLWILDMVDNKFVVWDTKQEELIKNLPIPKDVIVENSFLQDFVIDHVHNRLIIADMTYGGDSSSPAFIVMDMDGANAKRLIENHPSLIADNSSDGGLNPIAIDPSQTWIYYGALGGKTIYRVPTASFIDGAMVVATIEEYAPKSHSDGIAVDEYQNVYVANIEDDMIGMANKDGFRNIATLPVGQSWPDGLYIADDGYLYVTVSQLDRSAALNGGEDVSVEPFTVLRMAISND